MDAAQRSRLRRAAGLTLCAVTLFSLGVSLWALQIPLQPGEAWTQPQALALVLPIFVALPTALAAIGVLRGRRKGAVFGGLVGLTYGLLVAVMPAFALTSAQPINPAYYGELLVFVALAAAYLFAGIASLLTIDGR